MNYDLLVLLFVMIVLPSAAWLAQKQVVRTAVKKEGEMKEAYRYPTAGDIVMVQRNRNKSPKPHFELLSDGVPERLVKGHLLRVAGANKDEAYFLYETSPGVQVRFPTADVTLVRSYIDVDKGEIEIGDTVMVCDVPSFVHRPKPDGSGNFKRGDTFTVTTFDFDSVGYTGNTFSFKPHQVVLIKKGKPKASEDELSSETPGQAMPHSAALRQAILESGCEWKKALPPVDNARNAILKLAAQVKEQAKIIKNKETAAGDMDRQMARLKEALEKPKPTVTAETELLDKALAKIEKMIGDLSPAKREAFGRRTPTTSPVEAYGIS